MRAAYTIVLILAIAAAIGAYFSLSSSDPEAATEAEIHQDKQASDTIAQPLPTRAGRGPSGDSRAYTPSGDQDLGTPPEAQAAVIAPAASTIPSAFPLSPDQRTFLQPNVPEAKRHPLIAPGGDRNTSPKYFYEFSVSQFSLVDEESMQATLRVFDKEGNAVKAVTARPRVLASGANPQTAGIALAFTPEGDAAVATISGAELGLAPGMYSVAADVDIGGQMALAGAPFFYTPGSDVPGHFTGRVQHEVTDAGLVAAVEVSVVEAGEFIIDANLMGAGDEPIARANFRGPLPAGFHSVPLAFPAEFIKEKSNEGPFALHQLRGYKVRQDQTPNRVMMPDSPPLMLE